MFTKIMKFVCAVALFVAAFWHATPGPEILLDVLVLVGAATVAAQAVARSKYIWATGFAAIVVLFNPVVPVALSRKAFLWVDVVCILAFLLSLAALKRQPILSMPSITDRMPGSESL